MAKEEEKNSNLDNSNRTHTDNTKLEKLTT